MALRRQRADRRAAAHRLASWPIRRRRLPHSPRPAAACWRRWPTARSRGPRAGRAGRGRRRRGARPGRGRRCSRRCRCRRARPSPRPDPAHPGPALSPAQAAAAAALREAVADARVLRHAARRRHRLGQDRGLSRGRRRLPAPGRQALVLLPEIALSAQWLDRFRAPLRRRARRSGTPTSPRARAAITWRAVAEGRRRSWSAPARRCSCRSPTSGLIVVDEEHETAFKQEDGVIYHARDMAVVRARLCAGRRPCWSRPRRAWRRWPMSRPAATRRCTSPPRHGGAPLPAVAAIDLRDDAAGARALPRAAAGRGDRARRWRAASRRCCSSTAAAMRR